MGCQWCSSGLGANCAGPLGLDDLEVGCDCDCHKCPECGSAYCECMGGADPCRREDDGDFDYPEEPVAFCGGCGKPNEFCTCQKEEKEGENGPKE